MLQALRIPGLGCPAVDGHPALILISPLTEEALVAVAVPLALDLDTEAKDTDDADRPGLSEFGLELGEDTLNGVNLASFRCSAKWPSGN